MRLEVVQSGYPIASSACENKQAICDSPGVDLDKQKIYWCLIDPGNIRIFIYILLFSELNRVSASA